MLDLNIELSHHTLNVASFVDAAYWFEEATPRHKFTNVIAEALNHANYILVVARDMFDEELASAVVQFVRDNKSYIDANRPLSVLSGFHHSTYGFDTMFLINHEVHGLLKNDTLDLHLRTIQAFPGYRCEFDESDSVDLLNYVRSRFVSTLDWSRAPSPRVWLKFSNSITHSTGKKFGVTWSDDALQEILRIAEGKIGWAEMKNYLDEHIRIDYKDDAYIIKSISTEKILSVSDSEIVDWVNNYLVNGLDKYMG